MEKYIRTNEGIFKTLDKETDICVLTNKTWKYKKDILKQADNIEELCDEIVYNHQILSEEDRYNKEYLSKLYLFNDVYGAIWTDKGLIYVAKMNEKGELVLI